MLTDRSIIYNSHAINVKKCSRK